MMNFSSKNISPDSLTGMVFAMEGIRNVVVMLNGPMGCKFYHSATSEFLSIRPVPMLPPDENGKSIPVNGSFLNSWFFRQYRVPCTYLDGYDYVYGTKEKLTEGLRYLKKSLTFDLMVVINSPGASLIGDNLKEIAEEVLDTPVVTLESPGYSLNFAAGYEEAILQMFRQLKPMIGLHPAPSSGKKRVNLLGMSIWHRYSAGDRDELCRLFSLCGIEVNCIPGSGCSLSEIERIADADLNVVIYPEYGKSAAIYLQETYGTPFYLCDGAPIGFDAVAKMMKEVTGRLNMPLADAFIKEIEKSRALCWFKIHDFYNVSGLPKGVTFAIEGEPSRVYSYCRFFMDYLGMVPETLQIEKTRSESEDNNWKDCIRRLEEKHGAEKDIKEDMLASTAELVFGNGNTIAQLSCQHKVFCGIEIALPGLGYTDIVSKTHLGIEGAKLLTEQVLNGVMSKL